MPIIYTTGDILESTANILVNPVNCVGVMGKGLALQFKNKYMDVFNMYKQDCDLGLYEVGNIYTFDLGNNKFIMNVTTKYHWKDKTKIEWIENILKILKSYLDCFQEYSVALPKIGCGLGGLSWNEQVKPLVEKYLSCTTANVYVYE